jgi:endonuclease/exonuclease/phosphatase family metal-dependent hydrolase
MVWKIARKIICIPLVLLTICCIGAYLLAALNPYMNTRGWWLISLAGLFYPILFAALLLLILPWLFINKRWALVCGIVLVLGFRSALSTFAFHYFDKKTTDSRDQALTVMSYNIHEFKPVTGGRAHGKERFWDLIRTVNPDILCLQEFDNSDIPRFMASGYLKLTEAALNMPHSYYSRDSYAFDSLVTHGSVILTRLPVLDSGKIKLTDNAVTTSVIYLDLLAGTDTIRVMTTHLKSFGFKKADYEDLHRIRHFQEGMSSSLSHILGRLRDVFLLQNQQAFRLHQAVKESPYPVILCGDFNSVPNSYPYFETKGALQDAFLKKGKGMGSSYPRLSSTLRIDYIFADPSFTIASFDVRPELLSDHYPVVAKIILPGASGR